MITKSFPVVAHYFPTEGYGCIGAPQENPLREITAAERWLEQLGCPVVYGPLGASTWYPYRATLGPRTRPLFLGESDFDSEPWLESGYKPIARYCSNLADNLLQIDATQARREKAIKDGWKIKNLADLDLRFALERCHAISEQAFEQAFCYRPISLSAFVALYEPLILQLDPRLMLFAESPTGIIAGFCLAYPDVQNPSLRQFVLKSLAIEPPFGGFGIGSVLVGEAHRIAHQQGYVHGGIHAFMWERSHSQKISGRVGQLIREYALYHKVLHPSQ